MSGPAQMKSAVLIPDFAARVGSLPNMPGHIVTSARIARTFRCSGASATSVCVFPYRRAVGAALDGTRQAARCGPRACADPLWSRTTPSSRRLLSERIPYAIKQARGGERSHRDQEGGNEVMQHVAGDVAERGPEHARRGHAGYLSGGRAESSRYPHTTRTILRRVVPSVAAHGPCRLAECSETTHSPCPRLPRFVPAHAANFHCTPSRSGARRNRARA